MTAHGTRARYQAGCPCTPCRAANAAYDRALRRRGRAHGTAKTYRDGCLCEDCSTAYSRWAQKQSAAKRIPSGEVTYRLGELEHLIAGGVWPPTAAQRVGWSVENAERAAARHGRYKLAMRIGSARRKPLTPTA
ncbi:hypothetical protein ACTXL6_16500 [Brachybacterium tyrofermentans]|uniref:hypothetical protein n=1 Tax=Brachybacterium tyrofermentans TaxID=47848 RepID=UPI003FD6B5D0